MRITQEQIDQLFEEKTEQTDMLLGLYRLVFPDYDRIKELRRWPTVSDETWTYIARKFVEFDQKYHPNVMAGGLWMNTGFSSGKPLKFGEVSLEECQVIYHEKAPPEGE